MPWTLAGKTIHPDDGQFNGVIESHYAIQSPIDAVVDTINYWGASSERVSLGFILDEDVNAGAGLSGLKTAAKADANVALVDDAGGSTNWRILSLRYSRRQALNHTLKVWSCVVELLAQ